MQKYSARDEKGLVHCNECPLNVGQTLYLTGDTAEWDFTCYANIDGRTTEARALKRL